MYLSKSPEGIGWHSHQATLNDIWKVMAIRWSPWWLEKKATSHPFLKKGTKDDPGNYQPVSHISVLGKIMELILLEKMLRQMEEREVMWDNQHGFTKGRSCLTNLAAFFNGVIVSVYMERTADIIYLDFSKVFDMVPHNILFKLQIHRFDGWTVWWTWNRL